MTSIPKIDFGPRVEGDPVTYDVLIDGRKVGELRRPHAAKNMSTDPGLTVLGLRTTEGTAEAAKKVLRRIWKGFNDSERLLVTALGSTGGAWAAANETAAEEPPAGEPPADEPPAASSEPVTAEEPAAAEGAIPETWPTDEETMHKSKSDGLNNLFYVVERKNRFYAHRPKGHPNKTLGSAKPDSKRFITLADARAMAAARAAELTDR